MLKNYDTSVVPYNKFRFLTPDTVTTDVLEHCTIEYPPELRQYLFGAVSLLLDYNMWDRRGALTPEDVTDITNNFIRYCMDLDCDEVVSCLQGANGLRVEDCKLLLGDQVIVDLTICGNAPPNTAQEDEENLSGLADDKICGMSVEIADAVIDVTLDWLTILELAADTAKAVAEIIPQLFPQPGRTFEIVERIFQVFSGVASVGIAVVRADVNDNANRQLLICAIDEQIRCADGRSFVVDNVLDAAKQVDWGTPITNELVSEVVEQVPNKRWTTYAALGAQAPDSVSCVTCADCPPPSVLVTFDEQNWQGYSIIPALTINATGTVEESFGNPAPSGRGGRDDGCGFTGGCGELAVRVDLPVGGGTIDTVSFDYHTDIAGNWAQNVFIYDSSDSLIETLGGVITAMSGQWVGVTLTATVAQIATYIIVDMRRTNVSGKRTPFIDNIQINYA